MNSEEEDYEEDYLEDDCDPWCVICNPGFGEDSIDYDEEEDEEE